MLKLAFATTFNAEDVENWSGTPFHMMNAFKQQNVAIETIGNLKRRLPPHFKLKQLWRKCISGKRESPRFNSFAAKHYSEQVANQLKKSQAEVILAPQVNPIAYLDSSIPLVLWTDALYASLSNCYPGFLNHSDNSIKQGNAITAACLSRSALTIVSSDWAAEKAVHFYSIPPHKVKVVPFGANLLSEPTVEEIQAIINKRSRTQLKILFIGKQWERKGGDMVFRITKALHAAGESVELNFVGCQPPHHIDIPHYIHCHGFLSKKKPDQLNKLISLLQESHFLLVPSRAEAYGIVFCEANAFGVPCLTTDAGGIQTIVKNNVNGFTFPLDSIDEAYCNFMINLFRDYSLYEALAFSSFQEYKTRLNWRIATQTVKQLIQDIL
jgi:glycosyltransferase involved in cell wall biosynthesis